MYYSRSLLTFCIQYCEILNLNLHWEVHNHNYQGSTKTALEVDCASMLSKSLLSLLKDLIQYFMTRLILIETFVAGFPLIQCHSTFNFLEVYYPTIQRVYVESTDVEGIPWLLLETHQTSSAAVASFRRKCSQMDTRWTRVWLHLTFRSWPSGPSWMGTMS